MILSTLGLGLRCIESPHRPRYRASPQHHVPHITTTPGSVLPVFVHNPPECASANSGPSSSVFHELRDPFERLGGGPLKLYLEVKALNSTHSAFSLQALPTPCLLSSRSVRPLLRLSALDSQASFSAFTDYRLPSRRSIVAWCPRVYFKSQVHAAGTVSELGRF